MSGDIDNLIAKLKELSDRYTEIGRQISDPAIAVDTAKVVPLAKEQSKLRPIVSKYREYEGILRQIANTEKMLVDQGLDAELGGLVKEELAELSGKRERLVEEIKETLVMSEDAAVDSVIMEIRPGTGGDEAALFARDLHNMYVKYADRMNWKVEILDFQPTEIGGLREVILNIKGGGVWSHLGYEGGGHRVQRVPQTETQGRIHTSAATVAVLPEPEEIDVPINPNDVIEHVSRAGGPGGQSVNKLNSAIKLEHVPTGITVSMRDEKSQHKNRSKAWRILRSRVYEHYQGKADMERKEKRKIMIGSGDRSQRIRTYNFPQNRLTDHRINLSLYCLDKIILGGMEELVGALMDYDKQQRLKDL